MSCRSSSACGASSVAARSAERRRRPRPLHGARRPPVPRHRPRGARLGAARRGDARRLRAAARSSTPTSSPTARPPTLQRPERADGRRRARHRRGRAAPTRPTCSRRGRSSPRRSSGDRRRRRVRGLFRRAALDVHRAVFDARPGHGHADARRRRAPSRGAALREAPARARRRARGRPARRARSSATSAAPPATSPASRDGRPGPGATCSRVLTLAAGGRRARRSRPTAAAPSSQLGVGAVAAGVAGRRRATPSRSAIVLGSVDDPEDRAAAGAVWDAFLGDLRTSAGSLAGARARSSRPPRRR